MANLNNLSIYFFGYYMIPFVLFHSFDVFTIILQCRKLSKPSILAIAVKEIGVCRYPSSCSNSFGVNGYRKHKGSYIKLVTERVVADAKVVGNLT